jgi:DNA gyrase subunit A
MIIADNGIIIRMRAKEISKIGRDTQGVRMMKMKNQGSVVCVAVAEPDEEIEGEGEDGDVSEGGEE